MCTHMRSRLSVKLKALHMSWGAGRSKSIRSHIGHENKPQRLIVDSESKESGS